MHHLQLRLGILIVTVYSVRELEAGDSKRRMTVSEFTEVAVSKAVSQGLITAEEGTRVEGGLVAGRKHHFRVTDSCALGRHLMRDPTARPPVRGTSADPPLSEAKEMTRRATEEAVFRPRAR